MNALNSLRRCTASVITPLCCLLSSAVMAAPPDAGNPKAYALQLPLTVAADASLQRVLLPAQVLTALQSSRYADLRVLNSQGQAVPMALAGVAVNRPAPTSKVTLPAFPILGSAAARGLDGMTLRIDERRGKRTVQVSTTDTPAAAGTAAQQQVLGALFDARAVALPVTSLALDADLPESRPVTFSLQTSRDLKSWRPVAETVLYRAAGSTLGQGEFTLGGADFKDRYLRVTWADANGQPVAVTLRAATLMTTSGPPRGERVTAALGAPKLTDAHTLSFTLPFSTPLAALTLTPSGNNVLLPLRVLGRNDREQPWTPLTSAVVYSLQSAGRTQASGPIELEGASFRELRIEADAKTPGFTAPPAISLQFEPAQVIFLASGTAPFTLAAGLAQAPAAYLALGSLMPDYKAGQESELPLARVDASASNADLSVTSANSDAMPTRSLVLWGVLLLGVLLLAAMAWALMRQMKTPQKPADS